MLSFYMLGRSIAPSLYWDRGLLARSSDKFTQGAAEFVICDKWHSTKAGGTPAVQVWHRLKSVPH